MIEGRVTAVVSALMNPKTRRLLWARVVGIPLISRLLFAFQIANLTRTFGLLCDGGIPLTRGLRIAAELAPSDRAKERIDTVASAVLAGQSLSRSLTTNGLINHLHIPGS
jgi:type II secretory pathway component PulF